MHAIPQVQHHAIHEQDRLNKGYDQRKHEYGLSKPRCRRKMDKQCFDDNVRNRQEARQEGPSKQTEILDDAVVVKTQWVEGRRAIRAVPQSRWRTESGGQSEESSGTAGQTDCC